MPKTNKNEALAEAKNIFLGGSVTNANLAEEIKKGLQTKLDGAYNLKTEIVKKPTPGHN